MTDKQEDRQHGLEKHLAASAALLFGKKISELTDRETYYAVRHMTGQLMEKTPKIEGKKKVYYISAEFLLGRLLANNLLNLGIYDHVRAILAAAGKDLRAIEEMEPEPSLGNGGLGRLAACFLDSIATLGLPGDGIGLNYHFGLFKQVFADRLQQTEKNEWIEPQSWLNPTDIAFDVYFGKTRVTSRLYDLNVVGYGQGVNRLRLFDLESIDEGMVGPGIEFDKKKIKKNLTLFLYPDDSDEAGNLLRIYQQYFMVSNAAQLIIKEMDDRQYDLHKLYEHAVIQINDTHPTMIIPELIRILTAERGFTFAEAVEVVRKTCAYTNHTILAEALEKWPLRFLRKAVPQLVPIIMALDAKVRANYRNPLVQIIDKEKRVHMAHIDIHFGFSVNGVAAIHSEILKNTELNHFYEIYPERFNNKTNGITFRRWLMSCNRELTGFLAETIGGGFCRDAARLEQLMDYVNDDAVLDRLAAVKGQKKHELAEYVRQREGLNLNENAIFDIQIKRLHEYKRQQMNALYIIHKYLEIKAGNKPSTPLVFIFGAKAAPAYVIARDIIHLLLVLADIINNDPAVNQDMTVLMVENYNVSYAEKLIPACDVSEQISLASKEASGTGNMKFMLNGAVTLGTADGANVEIHQLVGDDNIYIFGQKAAAVIDHYRNQDYIARDYYKKSKIIKRAVDFITGKQALKRGRKENLQRLRDELINKDWFMTLLDLEEYIQTKERVFKAYEDRQTWKQKMLVNIARAGFFSSDRTIGEYNRDIWKLS